MVTCDSCTYVYAELGRFSSVSTSIGIVAFSCALSTQLNWNPGRICTQHRGDINQYKKNHYINRPTSNYLEQTKYRYCEDSSALAYCHMVIYVESNSSYCDFRVSIRERSSPNYNPNVCVVSLKMSASSCVCV